MAIDITKDAVTKKQFLQLVSNDYGNVEIGRRMGVCHETVRKWRMQLGLPPRKRGTISGTHPDCSTDTPATIAACLNCEKPNCKGYCELVNGYK